MRLADIYRHGGLLYGVNLLTSFVTFVVMILVSRAVSKEELGMFALFQAYFVLSGGLTGLGVSQSVVKFVAGRAIDERQIHTLIAWILAILSGMLLLAGFGLMRFGNPVLGLAIATVPAYHIFDIGLSYARGHLWRGAEMGILGLSSLANSVSIFMMVHWFPDHRGPMYGWVLGAYTTATILLVAFFRYRGADKPRFAPIEGSWVGDFVRVAAPIFVTGILFSVNDVADRLMAEHYLGLEILGEYFLAMMLFGILDRPVALLARVLLSHLCGPGEQADPTRHLESLNRLVRLNVATFPVFSLLVVSILPVVLVKLFNKDYSNSFDILAVMSVILVVKAFEVVNSMLAIARGNAKTNMYSQLVSFTVYIPLTLILVQVFGIFGIAVGMVSRWVVFSLFQFSRLRNNGVETVSPYIMLRAILAYITALAFYVKAPWLMVPVYLLAGSGLKLWHIADVTRSIAAWRLGAAEK